MNISIRREKTSVVSGASMDIPLNLRAVKINVAPSAKKVERMDEINQLISGWIITRPFCNSLKTIMPRVAKAESQRDMSNIE